MRIKCMSAKSGGYIMYAMISKKWIKLRSCHACAVQSGKAKKRRPMLERTKGSTSIFVIFSFNFYWSTSIRLSSPPKNFRFLIFYLLLTVIAAKYCALCWVHTSGIHFVSYRPIYFHPSPQHFTPADDLPPSSSSLPQLAPNLLQEDEEHQHYHGH